MSRGATSFAKSTAGTGLKVTARVVQISDKYLTFISILYSALQDRILGAKSLNRKLFTPLDPVSLDLGNPPGMTRQ